MHRIVYTGYCNNKIITAALLDLSKAFDSIKHNILKKLISMILNEKAVELLIDFKTDCRQQSIVNNVKIVWIKIYQGVPQGTVFGPLLFNLYIKALSKKIPRSCKIAQYADDTIFHRT